MKQKNLLKEKHSKWANAKWSKKNENKNYKTYVYKLICDFSCLTERQMHQIRHILYAHCIGMGRLQKKSTVYLKS